MRNAVIEEIAPHCAYWVDALGSVIAEKKGKKRPVRKLMICAHMDEVGMMVTSITGRADCFALQQSAGLMKRYWRAFRWRLATAQCRV